MSDKGIKIAKSPEPFSVLPRTFLQHPFLSAESVGVGVYLASQAEGWIPRPTQIQKHFRFGVSVWRRVAKELKQYGYLTEIRGGHGKGGTELEFDIWKNMRHKEEQPVPKVKNSDPLKIRRSENPTVGKSTPLDNKDFVHNKDSINNNNAELFVLDEEMRNLKIPESLRKEFLTEYSEVQIRTALKITKFNTPDKPGAYFKAALIRGYTLEENKKTVAIIMQEQTQEALGRVNKATLGANTPESKKARDEAMHKIKRIK